jgi:hypothetical protein
LRIAVIHTIRRHASSAQETLHIIAAANAKLKYESLIAEAEAARAKAMAEKGGAAAAVSALTAKAKLAGMWRDKVDQHNTGTRKRPVSIGRPTFSDTAAHGAPRSVSSGEFVASPLLSGTSE